MSLGLKPYEPTYDENGLPTLKAEISLPLPVPGEYMVLQLNPVAMAKHLGRPGLSAALRKLEFKRYLAIAVVVCTTPHRIC